MTLAAVLAAVLVERSEAGEFSDGTTVESAEFREQAEEADGAAPIDTGDLVEAIRIGFEGGVRVAQGEDLSFEFFNFAIKESNRAPDLSEQPRVLALMETSFFHSP